MNRTELDQMLGQLELSNGGLARLLKLLGDPGEPSSIRRRVERWGVGGVKVPGEAIALLNVLKANPGAMTPYWSLVMDTGSGARASRSRAAA